MYKISVLVVYRLLILFSIFSFSLFFLLNIDVYINSYEILELVIIVNIAILIIEFGIKLCEKVNLRSKS